MSQVSWKTPMKKGHLGRPGLGQPYNVESWSYTVRAKFSNEVVYAQASSGWLTHEQGVNQLLSLGATYGSNYVVCGTYKPVYQYYGVGTTYCTYDGGASYQVGAAVPPPPAPVPLAPIPFYTRSSIFPITESPFVIPFGSSTRITWTTRSTTPFRPIFGSRRVQWKGGRLGQPDLHDTTTFKSCYNMCGQKCTAQQDLNNPNNQAIFDACAAACDSTCLLQAALAQGNPQNVSALQNQVNAALKTQDICPIGADGKLGPTTCDAAIYVQTYIDGSVAVPAQCGSIDQTKSVFNPNCKTNTPGPTPGCTDAAGCSATQDCVNGKCVDKCPPNYTRNAAGECTANPAVSSTSSTGLGGIGALALAGLALGAFAFFGKPPKNLPKPANRLQANPKRRRRRRAA